MIGLVKTTAVIGLLTLSFTLSAQFKTHRKRNFKEIYPTGIQFKSTGGYIALGSNASIPYPEPSFKVILNNADTTINAFFNANENYGAHLEFGRHYNIKYGIVFHHFEWGAFGSLKRGSERYRLQILDNSTQETLSEQFGAATFFDITAGLSAFFSSVLQVSDYTFFDLGLGLRTHYRVFNKVSGFYPDVNKPIYPAHFHSNAVFKLGFGTRLTNTTVLIPSVESPIFQLVPLKLNSTTFNYFNSRFWPITVSVRLQFIRKRVRGGEVPVPRSPMDPA